MMKKIRNLLSILVLLILGFLVYLKLAEPKSIYPLNSDLGIEVVPSSLGQNFFTYYDRYTKVVAPNGKPIHIVAQNEITNEQLVRSRNILEHYLRDYPDSKYGSNKDEVANMMANNNAVLSLLNGQDDGGILRNIKILSTGIFGQALYKNEIQVEGNSWYINQDYSHRDAAYEEILHFVHDYGIGVDGPNSSLGAAPEYQKEIRAAQVNGLAKKIWADDERSTAWIEELDKENSLSQEYLASVIDTYYGLWGAWDGDDLKDNTKGMWGLYISKTRDEIVLEDPMAYDLMDAKFFHPYITYNARIDKDFIGTFSLKFDASIPYTNHSQYLKDITLLGGNDTNVRVNELDNDITGNEGTNTAVFTGNMSEYVIDTTTGVTTVTDNTSNRDGVNILRSVEKLKFVDQVIDL